MILGYQKYMKNLSNSIAFKVLRFLNWEENGVFSFPKEILNDQQVYKKMLDLTDSPETTVRFSFTLTSVVITKKTKDKSYQRCEKLKFQYTVERTTK